MFKQKFFDFCKEKEILLDKDVLNFFLKIENFDISKRFLEQILSKNKKSFLIFEDLKFNLSWAKKTFGDFISKEIEETPIKRKNLFGNVKLEDPSFEKGRNLTVKDFTTYFRNRFKELKGYLQDNSSLTNLISINKINGNSRNFSIIGMIYNKRITKNKNIILEVEDLTGKINVLVSQKDEKIYNLSQDVVLDAVVGFKCTGNQRMLFAKDILFPEISLPFKKKSPLDESVAFIGDIHFGSKNFMKEEFENFIKYLNGELENSEEALKIKYLLLVGDLVTGIGNYPNQERDLKLKDLELQFEGIADILGDLRKDLKIIICPGNHDSVRLMEPQPPFNEKYSWALKDLKNVFLVENPAHINIGASEDFEGFNTLIYHGFSYPYYLNNVSKLILENSADHPENIVRFLFKHRHLAPSHGSVQYFPGEKDVHLIRKIPDIFFSGHLHKSGLIYHNNILIVSGSSWETLTPYQEKFGNTPDHCKVPVFNLKTRAIKILDFEKGKNEN